MLSIPHFVPLAAQGGGGEVWADEVDMSFATGQLIVSNSVPTEYQGIAGKSSFSSARAGE